MKRLLFVCTGNICRSPTADGIARHLIRQSALPLQADSAGTHSYHIGEPPDARTIQTAKRYGVDLSPLRARLITPDDFHTFDVVLAMDNGHLRHLEALKPASSRAETALFMHYADGSNCDVPDPYYGQQKDFEYVYQLVANAMPAVVTRCLKETIT